ncbi:MAG: 30S ribosomal protein S12 methylthiotransferase RimO [Pseudomonadota bacterium]|jgi:ribosomal protein S12 methylthiotransferase
MSAKIGFVSLGCPKALVDSERIMTELRGGGYALSDSYAGADLVVVNTCGFIDAAKQESLDAIGEALAENGRVIVTGCMGANAGEILDRHPQVLAVTGPHAYSQVVAAVQQHLPPPPAREHDPHVDLLPPQGLRLTPPHYAYLKISEGCNHRCSFCIIPSMRGDLVSRPIGDVLAEAEALVDAGVRELLVISQDTSAYGVDVKYRTGFHGGRPLRTDLVTLARELGQLDAWVRLHYVYPYPHVDALIPLMADGLLLPYLDVPLQHASPTILKAMRRPAAVENTLERIHAWRTVCPDLTLRSTFIVGFPGETEADFETLLAFLDEAQLDRVGCFPYSPVAGAAANALPGAVPEALKQERLALFMEKQAAISARRLQDKIGRTIEVLVDEIGDDGAIARSTADAPEIDGVVYLSDADGVAVGDILLVDVEDADEHDLYAVPSLG